jgi:hypothetical protein
MTTPDLKAAALEYAKTHCCPPSCELVPLLEMGAAMMAEAIQRDLERNLDEMQATRKKIENGHPHGWASGLIL